MDHSHNNHDHGVTTHSMTCPVGNCGHEIEVHAHSDDDAVQKIMVAGKAHFEDAGHPADQAMSPEEMEKMTREAMKSH